MSQLEIQKDEFGSVQGITISQALELEVVYRALYLTNKEDIENAPNQMTFIRQLVRQYYYQPRDKHIRVQDDIRYLDYIKDKVKRLLKEKAGLLCVYDESREGHGGVRPDKVNLIAIDEEQASSFLGDILNATEGGSFKMVTEGRYNPQEIVIYRAILNVPLYVFGRMDRMRQYYHQFKHMAKRSKVLHIDKNWENTLLDLDPLNSQKTHIRGLVQSNIIQFASLLTMHNAQEQKSTAGSRKARKEAVSYTHLTLPTKA